MLNSRTSNGINRENQDVACPVSQQSACAVTAVPSKRSSGVRWSLCFNLESQKTRKAASFNQWNKHCCTAIRVWFTKVHNRVIYIIIPGLTPLPWLTTKGGSKLRSQKEERFKLTALILSHFESVTESIKFICVNPCVLIFECWTKPQDRLCENRPVSKMI